MTDRGAGCRESRLSGSESGWATTQAMGKILWHCRETRQQTEKTNIDLKSRQGEIPEGLSGSERLACKKRSVENLGGPIGSRGQR